MKNCVKVRGTKRCVRVDPDVAKKAAQRSWHMHKGYPVSTVGSGSAARKISLHGLALSCPAGQVVDHKLGDVHDARRESLRCATVAQNAMNAGPLSTSKTGLRGVVKHGSKFRGFIHKAGKTVYLGTFDADVGPGSAACAYDKAAARLFGSFARLNGGCGKKRQSRKSR